MSDGIAATQRFYGRWARIYDRVATAPGVTSWRERVVETLSLTPGDTVVEMGCGTGANFPYLREAVGPGGAVVGVDLVPEMLGQARERIDRRGWENVHVVQADATRPPVGDVDAVVSTFLIGMLADPASAVRTWIDRVAPGGWIAVMNARRSERALAAPLNLAFRAFVRLALPSGKATPRSPARELERRWEAARDALLEGTVDHERDTQGLGFIALASGRVPGCDSQT